MSYQSTVNTIRTVAETVNSSGRFAHGRHVDLSQSFTGDYPFIFLYPFTVSKGVDPEFIDTNTILIGFWMQDRSDTSTEEREAIIAEMDLLSEAFTSLLIQNDLLRVTNLTKEPQYQMYQGTLSGYAVRFQLQNFTACD